MEPYSTTPIYDMPHFRSIQCLGKEGEVLSDLLVVVNYMKSHQDLEDVAKTPVAILEVLQFDAMLRWFLDHPKVSEEVGDACLRLKEQTAHHWKMFEFCMKIFRPSWSDESVNDDAITAEAHQIVGNLFPDIAAKYPDIMARFS